MDASALTLIFDQVVPFLTSMGLGRRLPGFVGDCYRKRDYWQEQSREMVDHFLMMRSSGTAMGKGKGDKEFMVDSDKYLLSPLADGVDTFLGRKLTHEELVEQTMGYMFAGSGTTSSTLTYLLYAISRPENAHIQERVRTEVAGFKADCSVVTTARQNAYITAVIKEVFRLYPALISTFPRVLAEPLQVGPGAGFTVSAGTVVGMQNWIHHRDPAVFTDPKRFAGALAHEHAGNGGSTDAI
jgi:cytochrome P450